MLGKKRNYLANFEDNYTLSKLNQIFKKKRGWLSRIPVKNSSVILLISGGLDSICLWFMLMEKYKLQVYPIFYIDTKIRGEHKGLKSIKTFSKIFKLNFPTLFHEVFIKDYAFSFSFSSFRKRAYVDLATIYNNLLYFSEEKTYIPNLIDAPSRLGIYCFGAFEYAHLLRAKKNIGINTIFIGIIPEDGIRLRESTLSVLKSINLSLSLILGDFNWQILAPVEKKSGFFYTKRELVKKALDSNLPLDKTWSCKPFSKLHCGKCFNCISRREIFKSLNIDDKTEYYKPVKNIFKQFLIQKKDTLSSNIKDHLKVKTLNGYIKINPNSIIKYTKGTSWHEQHSKLYIMNHNNSYIEEFNSLGSFIWKEIVGSKISFSSLLEKVIEKYDVDNHIAERDLKKLLFILKKKGYIEINTESNLLVKK